MENVLESKKDEVLEIVVKELESKEEEIEKKVDEAETKIEKALEEVGKTLEDALKPASIILDKLDDNPQVAKAIELLVTQVDGRELSCSCFGWLVALRIARKSKKIPQAKSEELPKTETASPSQDSKAPEERLPTAPQSG